MNANLSRNGPCHCGSGIKYKKCCLPKDEAEEAAELEILHRELEELEDKANAIDELIASGDLDTAEDKAKSFLKEYPDQIDGLAHLGTIYMEKGDFALAADYFGKAADFASTNEGFEKRTVRWFRSLQKEAQDNLQS